MASVNRAALEGAVPVYVFASFRAGDATLQGSDAVEVIYRKPVAGRYLPGEFVPTPETVAYKGRKHVLQSRLSGCGVNRLACIFTV